MSQIRAIYSNLAAQAVTFATELGPSVTVAALDLHQLPVSVAAANAPLRLMLPYSTDTEGRDGAFASLDTLGRMDWYIADLLLWKPGTLASGIAESAADLVRYQGAYAEMLRSMRTMGVLTSDVELIDWRMRPGLYDWPIGSNTWWQGCMVILHVLEVMDS
jgi:hypothetical protein